MLKHSKKFNNGFIVLEKGALWAYFLYFKYWLSHIFFQYHLLYKQTFEIHII